MGLGSKLVKLMVVGAVEGVIASAVGKINTKVGDKIIGVAKRAGVPEKYTDHMVVQEVANMAAPVVGCLVQARYGASGMVYRITERWARASVVSAACRVGMKALHKAKDAVLKPRNSDEV